MKIKGIFLTLFLLVASVLLSGCGGNAVSSDTPTRCAKCGAVATETVSGHKEMFEKSGIPLYNCERMSDTIYCAQLCDDCVGIKAELTPN